jgi:hypothetical protein
MLAAFARMTQSKRHRTHRAPRAEHGSNSQGLPRRADAISKAGVRRPDTGRVVCHVSNHVDEGDRTITFSLATWTPRHPVGDVQSPAGSRWFVISPTSRDRADATYTRTPQERS